MASAMLRYESLSTGKEIGRQFFFSVKVREEVSIGVRFLWVYCCMFYLVQIFKFRGRGGSVACHMQCTVR